MKPSIVSRCIIVVALMSSTLLADASARQSKSWKDVVKNYELKPRQVSGRLTLKGGTPLVGWDVNGSATTQSMGVSAREGIGTKTDAAGAFAYDAPMTGWVQLQLDGPWTNHCFGSARRRLNPSETKAEMVVDGYLLQTPSEADGLIRQLTAQPIVWSNADLGGGYTDRPPMVVWFSARGGLAKALVPAGASYLVTKQRPGQSPLVAIIDGELPASIVDVSLQERHASLATFSVSIDGEAPQESGKLMVELRPVFDPQAPACTPRPVNAAEGTYRGAALPGRYRVVAWVCGRKSATHFVQGASNGGEVTLEAGKEAALAISVEPAGGIKLYPHWPSDLPRGREPRAVQAEVRLSGPNETNEWSKVRLLTASWQLCRAPVLFGRIPFRYDAFILEGALAPGEYQVRVSLPDRVSAVATVVVKSGGQFAPCHLAWQ
ncbi:MAG: hypothetical protein ACJA2W_002853 [Planctomycetota bacterium]|jgi:hypothetical protein